MRSRRNWLIFTVVVIVWGLNWVVMKNGLRTVGPLNFVVQRFLFASAALSPLVIRIRSKVPRDKGTWFRLALLSVLNAASILLMNVGLAHEKTGISAVLTYTQPLFVFCLAVFFLKEEVSWERLLGLLTGFLGVAILYFERDRLTGTVSSAVPLLLLGAFLWGVSTVYYKVRLSHVDSAVANAVQFSVGAVLLSFPAMFFEGLSFSLSPEYIFIILYMSVGASATASTLWILLLKEEEVTVVSTSSYAIPMVALVLGWLCLGETVGLESLLGFVLILAGVRLANKG